MLCVLPECLFKDFLLGFVLLAGEGVEEDRDFFVDASRENLVHM
jgi:hypothetical protein